MAEKKMPAGKEGFTLGMALLDAVPVLAFGADMLLLSRPLQNTWFLIGAVLSFLGGLCMVVYKLILSTRGKEYPVFKKMFPFFMSAGWILMILGAVLARENISLAAILSAVTAFPAVIFYALALLFFGAFIVYWRTKFDGSARSNWVEEILNACAQVAMLIGVLLSVA